MSQPSPNYFTRPVNLNENETSPIPAENWTIRPLASTDRAAVLRLNAENRPALAAVEAVELDQLLAYDGHHLVAVDPMGEVVGFLLSFPRESRYDDSEINELRRRVSESFYYICQVAIASTHRGRGIGRAFYDALAGVARARGARLLCCDVNLAPPNPTSLAFHDRLGFDRIGTGTASNGFSIAFLTMCCELADRSKGVES